MLACCLLRDMVLKNLLQCQHMALIEKQAIKNYWDIVRPGGIDVAYSVAITALILFVLGMPTILDKYNTFGAREVLASDTGSFVSRVLLRIDELSFTNNVVTFLLWGLVGMVVYALVSSLLRALAKAELERELASDTYVHPAAFSRTKFWREELLISATTMVTMAVLLAVCAFVFLTVLPSATVHLRSLITSNANASIWPTVASTILLIVGINLVITAYKLWRHRAVLFEES